jgi:hypothetical protein
MALVPTMTEVEVALSTLYRLIIDDLYTFKNACKKAMHNNEICRAYIKTLKVLAATHNFNVSSTGDSTHITMIPVSFQTLDICISCDSQAS